MQAAVSMDPWAIAAMERTRHAEQFAGLAPVNGFVTGAQAKGFFMQSGLSPVFLAQIWGLADLNGDGQMDLNEFSIACKLITMKLKGFELPAALPPAILAIPQMGQVGMAPQASMAAPGQVHIMTSSIPSVVQQPAVVGLPVSGMSMVQPTMTTMGAVPVTMNQVVTAPQQVVPMAGTPTQDAEWDVPLATQSKYGAIFTQTDKARVGVLAGAQARNILLQSGLPQNVLAQIWTLSDVDKDGRLNREEFILAGHLCDLSVKGEPLPAVLPPTLMPAQQRRANSETAASTPGSSVAGTEASFEDKRRENFNKGQQELERRRQSIIDQQKREEEEKKKKEKEEEEERKRQKEEEERQRLAEWEAKRKEQLLAHRQGEEDKLLQLKNKQQNLNTDLETLREKVKDLTTGISDTRTGVSDIKTFIDGMRNSRDQKVQEMNSLKARLREQNERLLKVTQEKAQMEAKNKANAENLNDDSAATDFELKIQAKEKEIGELKEQLEEVKGKETSATEKHATMKELMKQQQDDLEKIIESCKVLYSLFDDKRREVRAEKAKRIRELTDPDHAWGHENEEVAPEAAAASTAAATEGGEEVKYEALYDYAAQNDDELNFSAGEVVMVSLGQAGEPGWLAGRIGDKSGWIPEAYLKKAGEPGAADGVEGEAPAAAAETVPGRVLYDLDPVNDSCMALKKGEVVTVTFRPEDAKWWYGKIGEAHGYLPCSYVCLDAVDAPRGSTPAEAPGVDADGFRPLQFEALFAYASEEPGDLVFEAGEVIEVTKMEAEWWTGKIGEDRTGVFPFNYVKLKSVAPPAGAAPAATATTDAGAAPAAAEPVANDIANNAAAQPAAAEEEKKKTSSMKRSKKKKKHDDGDKKKPVIAKVVAPYEATSKEQLTLAAGQLILIRKKTDTGWWQGEIQGGKGKKRNVGWFPASFVQLMEGPGAGGGGGGGGGEAKVEEAPAGGETDGGGGFAKALYDYNAQQGDELSFQEGAMIKVVSKEDQVWWKGELDGKVGVFPANYVEEVK